MINLQGKFGKFQANGMSAGAQISIIIEAIEYMWGKWNINPLQLGKNKLVIKVLKKYNRKLNVSSTAGRTY